MNPRFPGQRGYYGFPADFGFQQQQLQHFNMPYMINPGPYFSLAQQLPFANSPHIDYQQPSVTTHPRNKNQGYFQPNSNKNQGYTQPNRQGRDFHSQKRSREQSDEETSNKRPKSSNPRSISRAAGSINNQITESIWRYYENNRQSDEVYRKKVDLRDALYAVFKDIFPYCGLYMVGSSMSGFATRTSDMDLCLMLSPEQIDGKREAVEILIAIQRALRRCSFHRRSLLIRARVPILKFEDPHSGVECDLNINNSVGIRNTHLLRYYAAMDWRVRPLVLFVKKWARFHDINDASKKTISSYSLCLMVIHYLQCGTNPPVLESVQKMNPSAFEYGDDIRNLKMDIKVNFKSKNSQSLGDLFLGFLEYYTLHFNFLYDVASVRQGQKLPLHMVKMMTNDQRQWGCLKIEEPFDMSNTARSCFDAVTFMRVRRVITKSYNLLSTSRDVNAILSAPF